MLHLELINSLSLLVFYVLLQMPESSLIPHLKSLLPITVLQKFQRREAPAKPNGTQQGNTANNMPSNGQLRVKQTWSNQVESSNLSLNGAQRLTGQDNQAQTATSWSSSPDPRYQVTPQEQGTVSAQTTNLECSGGTPKRLHMRQIPPSDSCRPLSGSDSDSDTDVPLTQNGSCKRRNLAAPETLNVASAGCDTEQINTHGRLSPLS